MNAKRIAALLGVIGIAVCVLCMVVSGFVPALKDLLWTIGGVAFLIGLTVWLFFYFRRQEEQPAAEPEKK